MYVCMYVCIIFIITSIPSPIYGSL